MVNLFVMQQLTIISHILLRVLRVITRRNTSVLIIHFVLHNIHVEHNA
jgi:hypothetical protein